MPGGKMEQGENIKESVTREFEEETGLRLINPQLRGSFTMVKTELDTVKEWMMFTFFCDRFEGNLLEQSKEGKLEWIPIERVFNLPTAPTDKYIHEHLLQHESILYGTFKYGSDYQITDYRLT